MALLACGCVFGLITSQSVEICATLNDGNGDKILLNRIEMCVECRNEKKKPRNI